MKKIVVLLLIAFVAAAGWNIGNQLSSDALGMSVGILLGVLAGLPVALLVIAAGRRGGREQYDDEPRYQPQGQAPMIMLVGGGQPQQWQGGQMPGQQPQQHYLAAPQWHKGSANAYDLWEEGEGASDY